MKTLRTLRNGAKVLAEKPSKFRDSRIVLAYYFGEYVTWVCYANDPDEAHHGHYFTSLTAAHCDWVKRNGLGR